MLEATTATHETTGETMAGLTTTQAWQMAKRLFDQGLRAKQVAAALKKTGYVSYRSGKALDTKTVHAMKYRLKRGYMPTVDRSSGKAVRAPRARATFTAYVSTQTKWDLAKYIDETRVLSDNTKRAIIDLIVKDQAL